MIQSQCQQVNFAYLVCEAPPHFFDGYTIRYYMRMLWPNQKKNVECTPTPPS